MIPNPGFKVTVYLQVEYLKNGAFYGQSYWRTLSSSSINDVNDWKVSSHGPSLLCGGVASACIDEITDWMASNRLMLNPSKTDLLWCYTRGHPDGVMQTPRGVSVEPSCLVRNLGVSLVKELTLTTQPTGRPVLRTAAEHQELSTSLDTECSSNDGEQFHRLTNRLLQQSTHGLQSAF